MNYKDVNDLRTNYLKVVNNYFEQVIGNSTIEIGRLILGRTAKVYSSISYEDVKIFEKLLILLRGITLCNNFNRKNGIPFLLTGINPSFPNDSILPWGESEFILNTETNKQHKSTYWKNIKDHFGELCDKMAYFDLFPLRESSQDVFEKTFGEDNVFRRQLLELSQKYIEDLKPKLIVHANRRSMYYWGINNRYAFIKESAVNNIKDPWMGYKVEIVPKDELPDPIKRDKRYESFPVYKIIGLVDSENRINKNCITQTGLTGSYIMEYVMGYRNKTVNTLYKYDEWEEIWSWFKDR